MKLELGKDYTYADIAQWAQEEDYDILEHGAQTVGENILVLRHNQRDVTLTLVLSGATGYHFIYTLVYDERDERGAVLRPGAVEHERDYAYDEMNEHPVHTHDAWADEANRHDTFLGYSEWVMHRMEEDEDEEEED